MTLAFSSCCIDGRMENLRIIRSTHSDAEHTQSPEEQGGTNANKL